MANFVNTLNQMCDESRALTSTPSSTTSGCVSGSGDDTISEENLLPISLANNELQLTLNMEATEEELQKVIARCKEMILESEHCSVERKWLVRHLIELRLRLQECREAQQDPKHPRNKSSGASKRTVKEHHLVLQPLLRTPTTKYCDNCTGTIWSVVQAWFECEDCGYSCHYKCLSTIKRECAHVTASEKGGYNSDICPEIGLSSQRYLCAECKAQLPIGSTSYSEARKCDYTGLYYCSACHWGSSAVIPARVIHNWDMSMYPVCQASLQQLRITSNRPLINVEKLNNKLFQLVHELNLVRRLRNELNGMRKYLLVCRLAQEDHLLWKHVDTPHLIESPDLYSLQDLLDTHTGELPTKLHNLVCIFSKHIKDECQICNGRGHICEICSNNEVVFPFDNNALTCNECSAVLHKLCYERKSGKCPKCLRIQKRKEEEEAESESKIET